MLKPRNKSRSETAFDILIHVLLIAFSLLCLYPFVYVLSCSLSDTLMVDAGKVFLFPVGFTLSAYRQVLQDERIFSGFMNSVLYTAGSTVLDVFATFCVGYALSSTKLPGKKFFFLLFAIPSFIPKGLIPTYVLMDNLHLVDNRLVMIIPGLLKIMHIVLVRNYIGTIPKSLEESAQIDGANPVRCLFRIIIPLCLPILATITLFRAVDEWNTYMQAVIYLRDANKHPLTVVLWRILVMSQVMDESTRLNTELLNEQPLSTASLKYATTVLTILPIILIYPFLQRYFVKGIVLGAVKE